VFLVAQQCGPALLQRGQRLGFALQRRLGFGQLARAAHELLVGTPQLLCGVAALALELAPLAADLLELGADLAQLALGGAGVTPFLRVQPDAGQQQRDQQRQSPRPVAGPGAGPGGLAMLARLGHAGGSSDFRQVRILAKRGPMLRTDVPRRHDMPRTRIPALVLSLLLVAPAAWAAEDISKVNGSISVSAGAPHGELSTVNGSIAIGEGARS